MIRIVVRPRIQRPLLVVIFAVFVLLGADFFAYGDLLADREWFGIAIACMIIVMGIVGIWRALRLGVVIDAEGVRVRGFDSRDQFTPWSKVESVECMQVDSRAGLPLYAPVIRLAGNDAYGIPIMALGSYSQKDAEQKAEGLRSFQPDADPTLPRGE